MNAVLSDRVRQISSASLCDAMSARHDHRCHLLDLVSPAPGRVLFGPAATVQFMPMRRDRLRPAEHDFAAVVRAAATAAPAGRMLVMAKRRVPGRGPCGRQEARPGGRPRDEWRADPRPPARLRRVARPRGLSRNQGRSEGERKSSNSVAAMVADIGHIDVLAAAEGRRFAAAIRPADFIDRPLGLTAYCRGETVLADRRRLMPFAADVPVAIEDVAVFRATTSTPTPPARS